MRVCIVPLPTTEDKADGGIRRVSDAQAAYLPKFGVQVTNDPGAADLIACHGATLVERPGVPLVAHSHGLMWEDYNFGDWGDMVNAHIVDALVRAQAITAPSAWVAHAISRGMLAAPEVIYHGVDADVWAHDEGHLNYVLWNKARVDPVSDPADMQVLAAQMSDLRFVTTFGQNTQNVMALGALTYDQMKPVVQRAAVYLATARETFGIGTLEALAAGVPIAGWNYGGQKEIVVDGETGYLAPFGDVDALADCVRRCLAQRARLSANAAADARARWGWKDKIGQYAALYERVYAAWEQPRPKVSVIITCYNLAHYLGDALNSVAAQTMTGAEVLVVDDCGADGEQVKQLTEAAGARYLRTPENLGLSGARNYGFSHASGRYILYLDADDQIDKNTLDTLSTALDQDTGIHIAYGSLDLVNHLGEERRRGGWPRGAFNWHGQIAHLNQLPYCAMLRREVLERSGGYRTRDWRAEDAALWARVTSLGFRAAKVTDDATLIYRLRSDSKGSLERRDHADVDGDWTALIPWRLAATADEGLAAVKAKKQPNARIVPFGAQGDPPPPLKAWPVRHFAHPAVSVIIPVGPGHAAHLIDALDSVQAQTMVEWECIVVNDSGEALDLTGHPWVQVWETYDLDGDGHSMGAGFARNVGLVHATAPLTLFLDADDMLLPHALMTMLRTYVQTEGRYVYSGWLRIDDEGKWDGPYEVFDKPPDFDRALWLRGFQHAVTALVPTDLARDVGGFDEGLPALEDWDFYLKLLAAGLCGHAVRQPLFIYRSALGSRRKVVKGDDGELTETGSAIIAALRDRYAAAQEEITTMGCCGGSSAALQLSSATLESMVGFATAGAATVTPEGAVRMEFIGGQEGAQSYIGRHSGRIYRAGRSPNDRYHDVDPRDVQHMLDMGLFRVVPPPPPPEPEPGEAVVVTASKVRGRKVPA